MTDQSENPETELDLNFHTDMPVGEILRRTRTHYGQSLLQIEGVLRIRASQLDALEKGDISQLPGRVYAIGFVRSYSEYLGLDGDKMVQLFKDQSVGKQKRPSLSSFPVPASESKVPNIFIIGSCIFGVLVLIGFVSFLMFPEAKKNEIPTVPEELTKSQLNEAPSLVAGQPETAPAQPSTGDVAGETAPVVAEPPKPSNRVTLEIVDSSWVEVRNASGEAILRQVLKSGDIYLVPNEPGLLMATGNAGGIKIKVDGKEIGALGQTGQIKRKVSLDPSALLSAANAPAPAVVPKQQQAAPRVPATQQVPRAPVPQTN